MCKDQPGKNNASPKITAAHAGQARRSHEQLTTNIGFSF
jgi:hypothetical protein